MHGGLYLMKPRSFLPALMLIILASPAIAAEAAFRYSSSACSDNGNATIEFLHFGRLVYVKDTSLFMTYDVSGKTIVQGIWKDKFGKPIDFVKADLSSPDLVSFEAADGSFTRLGNYS